MDNKVRDFIILGLFVVMLLGGIGLGVEILLRLALVVLVMRIIVIPLIDIIGGKNKER